MPGDFPWHLWLYLVLLIQTSFELIDFLSIFLVLLCVFFVADSQDVIEIRMRQFQKLEQGHVEMFPHTSLGVDSHGIGYATNQIQVNTFVSSCFDQWAFQVGIGDGSLKHFMFDVIEQSRAGSVGLSQQDLR